MKLTNTSTKNKRKKTEYFCNDRQNHRIHKDCGDVRKPKEAKEWENIAVAVKITGLHHDRNTKE